MADVRGEVLRGLVHTVVATELRVVARQLQFVAVGEANAHVMGELARKSARGPRTYHPGTLTPMR